MKANKPEITRELITATPHMARCYSVVDLGTHTYEWKGNPVTSRKVRVTWELPEDLITYTNKEGVEVTAPQVIGQEYSLSMGTKSKLRPVVESMIGTKLSDEEAYGFEITDLVGMACMLQVVHVEKNGNTYANIGSIMQVMKSMTCPAQVNPSVIFEFDNWKQDVYEKLPQFIREKIDESQERMMKKTVENHDDSEDAFAGMEDDIIL